MPYRALSIPAHVAPHVAGVVRRLEDHYFRDVHCLLRLPIPNYRLTAGCNFTIAQVLMSVIGGLSTTLYGHGGESGRRFKRLLIDFYPWDLEPLLTVTPTQGAEVIYSVFRNPLAHNLGLDIEKKARTLEVKVKRLATKGGTRGLTEKAVELLERTDGRITMSPTVTLRSGATVLLVEALYWGTRVMIERLLNDATRMTRAEAYLASL
jgi:hypothetical protein